jgi:exosortase
MGQVATLTEPIPTPARAAAFWWQFAALAGLVGCLYWSILARLGGQWWSDPNFSHGFLVPVFSLFVLWHCRGRFIGLLARPSWWGLPILLSAIVLLLAGVLGSESAIVLLLAGVLGSESFLARISLLVMIAGLVVWFLGWSYFRVVLFAWAFLFFMIPIPAIVFNQITFPLQILASQVAAFVLPLAGVPVLREGNVINLPAMPLEVAEACSGIRSLISLSTLAVIYGYFRETRTLTRVILAFASVPIAILANSFRIVGTGLLVEYWSPDKAEGFFHALSGALMFLFSLVLLGIFHRLLLRFGHRFGDRETT